MTYWRLYRSHEAKVWGKWLNLPKTSLSNVQWPQVGLVYSGKKLLQIPINNEKMHNILRIYGVLRRTFTGHRHLRVYLGRAETHGATGRRCRCLIFFVCVLFLFPGPNVKTTAAFLLCAFVGTKNMSLMLHHRFAAQMHSRQTGRAAQMKDTSVDRMHRHLQNSCALTLNLRHNWTRLRSTDKFFGVEQNISNCTLPSAEKRCI